MYFLQGTGGAPGPTLAGTGGPSLLWPPPGRSPCVQWSPLAESLSSSFPEGRSPLWTAHGGPARATLRRCRSCWPWGGVAAGAWAPPAPLTAHRPAVPSTVVTVQEPLHRCPYKLSASCHSLAIYSVFVLFCPEQVYDFGMWQMFISLRGGSHMLFGNGTGIFIILSNFEKICLQAKT